MPRTVNRVPQCRVPTGLSPYDRDNMTIAAGGYDCSISPSYVGTEDASHSL